MAAPPPPWQTVRGAVGVAADRLLSLDPGHTTGWAWWEAGELVRTGQVDCLDLSHLVDVLDTFRDPTAVVLERYAIYPSKLDQHTLSSVYTLQVIGAIKVYALMTWRLSVSEQGAGDIKRFATSDRLRAWGLWQRSAPHANDAVRHGAYYLTFRK